ncbi:MAG: dual specificity protein phosphatase family protein [Gammaproteobacteria bacterium]|nr:dual specificity protein phosphatase family protein [Gammaproteobacteria bacterium]
MAPDIPIKITDNLYLGNFNAASYSLLKKYNIVAVVCLTHYAQPYTPDINLLHISDISETLAEDSFTLDKLLKAVKFIEEQIQSGHNVLVHCKAGASRSPTIILAYIMKKFHFSVEEAYKFTVQKAQHINPTFRKLLSEYASFLKSE